jgi:hypothetical protein
VPTEVGPIPRDWAEKFEPKIVPKHARQVEGFDDAVVLIYQGLGHRGDLRPPGRDLLRSWRIAVATSGDREDQIGIGVGYSPRLKYVRAAADGARRGISRRM